ncbi:MAG: transcriptional repressor NrdR [Lentisphaeria bacterium]|nr:transcriptional repressor NrdR [Lentisphaeria bacterium]
MRCPVCGCLEDKVIDSRSVRDDSAVRRRRECLKCTHRFTTYESIINDTLKVIKRNGVREDFDPEKLRRGIVNACYNRPVTGDDIDRVTGLIAASILRDFDKEITSSEIGNRVMAALKEVDQVAYVRFASVYRKFKDVEEFIAEIRALK